MRLLPILLLAALTAGCSSKRDARDDRREEANEAPAAEANDEAPKKKEAPVRIFDADGKLVPSEEYAGGLALPLGAELFRANDLIRVYRIRAPIKKVLQYLGPRLITGNVKKLGEGAVYKNASVKGAEMNPTKIDVSIAEIGSNLVRIQILEIPPPPEYAPPPTQTKSAARDQWRRLD